MLMAEHRRLPLIFFSLNTGLSFLNSPQSISIPFTMQSTPLTSVTFEKDVDKALKGTIRRTGMYKKEDGCAQL